MVVEELPLKPLERAGCNHVILRLRCLIEILKLRWFEAIPRTLSVPFPELTRIYTPDLYGMRKSVQEASKQVIPRRMTTLRKSLILNRAAVGFEPTTC
jgi:hypothetical protein